MFEKVKRFAALVLAVMLMIAPSPDAAAYGQVCVKGIAGIGFAGKFRLVWGVPDEDTVWRKIDFGFPFKVGSNSDTTCTGGFASRGATHWSPDYRLGTEKCVNLEEIPLGERFVIQNYPYGGNGCRNFCIGWEDDRGSGRTAVFVNNEDNRDLTLKVSAWGPSGYPKCRPVAETDAPRRN